MSSQLHRIVEKAGYIDELIIHDAVEKKVASSRAPAGNVKSARVFMKLRTMFGRRANRVGSEIEQCLMN